ncbi:hypothetical protein ACOMHN_049965 [Nucella lapillus]
MVLTDLPFERGKLLHSRYEVLRPGSAPPPEADSTAEAGQDSKDYAAFLKSQERKVGPEGFLDSTRYSHTFQLKKDKESKSAPAKSKATTTSSSVPSVVSLTAKVEKDEKDYRKRIKVVEDHMWQHKQEERELKRAEGDIIKNQRAVRHTLRDFGNVINKKRMAEEKKLNQSLERFSDMQREHVHKKHELTRKRAEKSISSARERKQEDKKTLLNLNDLNRQYEHKMSALDLKRVEVMRLSQDFETKMRTKEEEQHRLKNELAELAITLNMVAQKGRVQQIDHGRAQKNESSQRIRDDLESDINLDTRMQRSDGDVKGAEMTKRKLSADLVLTRAHLGIKKRDEQRHLTGTQIRLEDNTTIQRQLNQTARHAEMDLKARQLQQRLQAHNAKRIQRLQTSMQTKRDKEEAQQTVWEARFKVRAQETDRKKHEDSLKFFTAIRTCVVGPADNLLFGAWLEIAISDSAYRGIYSPRGSDEPFTYLPTTHRLCSVCLCRC